MNKLRFFLNSTFCFILLLLSSALQVEAAQNGNWILTGEMITKRIDHSATLLNNGKVLVVGGRNTSSNSQDPSGYLTNAELYDPQTKNWSPAGNLSESRYGHTATRLKDGRVLIVGGYNSHILSSVEIYNPLTNTWSSTDNLHIGRMFHQTTLLENGKVLVTGGEREDLSDRIQSSVEVYDPISGHWELTQSMIKPRYGHSSILLKNGNVLVIGGSNFVDRDLSSTEIYNPDSQTWSYASDMLAPRMLFNSFLLPSNKVLIYGGGSNNTILNSAEIYDPETNIWNSTGNMTMRRINSAHTVLFNGEILVVGGQSEPGNGASFQSTAEIYNPTEGIWELTKSMPNARYGATATTLLDGSVLVSGGSANDSPIFARAQGLIYSHESTPTPTSTPAPQITLTDYKQTDPRWASARLYNSSNCGTMYSYGCAITSVADVFYSYGKTLLANMQLTPGILNNALGNNNGFDSECGIIWSKPAALVDLGAPELTRRKPNGEWKAGEGSQTIDNALTAGNLPIIGINAKFGPHFLVVSAKLPDVNGKPDYKLVDPAQYPFVANNPGNSGKSLSQVYGGFDKVFEVVVYKNYSTPQKTLTVRAHSPVQLLITDPDGNQTGYDIESHSINENIPNSSYGIEPGIAPVDGSAPALGETKYFQQIDPSDGDYTIQLIGTGNGSYTLDVTKTDEESNTSTQVIKGYAQSGVTESYQLTFTSDATEQPTLEKEVTFDVLKDDIKTLYSQKQIKNQLIFATLKLQAEIAEKASEANRQPLGNKLAILALKTFQLELKKVRGKSITEDAYQILNNDVNALINNLQGDSNTPQPTPTPGNGGS